jgi:hypothetical protein
VIYLIVPRYVFHGRYSLVWVTAYANIPKGAFECTVVMLRGGPECAARLVITGAGVPEVWRCMWGEDYVEHLGDVAPVFFVTSHDMCTGGSADDEVPAMAAAAELSSSRQVEMTRVVRVVVTGGEEAAGCLRDEARRVAEETPPGAGPTPFVLSVDIDYFSSRAGSSHKTSRTWKESSCLVLPFIWTRGGSVRP